MINCHLHDYIELACVYRLPIRLALLDGSSIDGLAKNVIVNSERQECLLIDVQSTECLVVLLEVVTMSALQKNPYFDVLEFK